MLKSIPELEARIAELERENAALRRLTASKRFQLANKVADAYNHMLPQGTRRRAAISKITTRAGERRAKRSAVKSSRTAARLRNLSAGYDRLIVFNSTPYDTGLRQRSYHLAHEFARLGYFVVYYEPTPRAFRQISTNFVTINSHELLRGLPAPRKFFLTPNNAATPLSVLKTLKSWGYHLIYDYLDEFDEAISGDLSAARTVWKNLTKLAPDLVLVTASRLSDDVKTTHPELKKHLLFLPNAADVDHFSYKNPAPRTPSDLAPLLQKHHKIVGYYGALAAWTDYDLLNFLAENHPDYEFVLLGLDYDGTFREQHLANNIHYLGAKPYDALPAYSRHFHCALIPFRDGAIAKSTSPLKLYEYLAAGLPVVCTKDLTECRNLTGVYVAEDAADYDQKLVQAIRDHNDPEKRAALFAIANANTWHERAATLDAKLATLPALGEAAQTS